MRQQRYFTVEEANRLIPMLKRDLSELRNLQQDLEALGAELTPLFEIVRHNGGHPKSPQFLQLAKQYRETIEHLHSYGCLIKNIDPGLLDFPHIREGREVYLCWQAGEEEIRYWHDIDAGFTGRQLI